MALRDAISTDQDLTPQMQTRQSFKNIFTLNSEAV